MNDLSDWRPISICCTLYKVYASVIARRIQRWAVDGGVVSPEQKGFVPTEGVYEHVFMLDSVVADAQMRRRPLVVSYLDIRNAFGSVRHECITSLHQSTVVFYRRRVFQAKARICGDRWSTL